MLRLTEIKRTDTYIEAYYTPEDITEKGYIKIDLKTGETIEKRITSYDGFVTTYLNMASQALENMKNDETLPETKVVMWY